MLAFGLNLFFSRGAPVFDLIVATNLAHYPSIPGGLSPPTGVNPEGPGVLSCPPHSNLEDSEAK